MTQVDEMTRPIIGFENRTAQEVFDIMADRIRSGIPAADRAGYERGVRESAGVAKKRGDALKVLSDAEPDLEGKTLRLMQADGAWAANMDILNLIPGGDDADG